MNGLALCAGIGGLELGLKLAIPEYKTVCYVEREIYCVATLIKRMEEGWLDKAPIWSDIGTFDGHPWRGKVDIISAGFPCQPWSQAGKRKGTEDDRWLWPAIKKIIGDIQPRYAFLENVPGLLRGGIEHVLGSLALLGFDAEWGHFSAQECGAPHKRQRLFILAYTEHVGRTEGPNVKGSHAKRQAPDQFDNSNKTLANTNEDGWERERLYLRQGGSQETPPFLGGKSQDVPDSPISGLEGRDRSQTTWPTLGKSSSDHQSNHWWSIEPDVGRVVDGCPFRVDRLRALGNGVVPEVARRAYIALKERIDHGKATIS